MMLLTKNDNNRGDIYYQKTNIYCFLVLGKVMLKKCLSIICEFFETYDSLKLSAFRYYIFNAFFEMCFEIYFKYF